MRVRGLKQGTWVDDYYKDSVAPRAGAWVETYMNEMVTDQTLSHPVRVRGLKPKTPEQQDILKESHPVRVRGLKLLLDIPRRA